MTNGMVYWVCRACGARNAVEYATSRQKLTCGDCGRSHAVTSLRIDGSPIAQLIAEAKGGGTTTIGEAIDRNVELKGELVREGRLEKAASVQLGIEALKRDLDNRRINNHPDQALLPGETE